MVVGMVPSVNALHPAAKEKEASQTEGHEHDHCENAKEPGRKIVDPVERHTALLETDAPRSPIEKSYGNSRAGIGRLAEVTGGPSQLVFGRRLYLGRLVLGISPVAEGRTFALGIVRMLCPSRQERGQI